VLGDWRAVPGPTRPCGSGRVGGNIPPGMPRVLRMPLMVAVAVVAAGCGAAEVDGSSTTNGGVVPVAQSGTYAYRVTIPPPGPSQLATDCSGAHLVLTNDSGTIESLGKSGSLYFTAGNWTGSLNGGFGPGCEWKVTLTPS
jgi:hypothetical protein